MIDKQVIDKLKNDVACKENIINHLAEHNIKLQHQLKAKEQECEQEKTLKEMYFTYYKAKHGDVKAKLFQYKQALTEIKKIANKVLLNTHDLELFKEADALFGALLEIHKLISEVENEY